MKHLFALGMSAILLVGCEVEVKGPIEVKEAFKLNIEFKKRRKEYKGSLGLVKGKTYDSEIKFNSKRKVTLIVKDIKFEGKKIDMKAAFKVPKGTKLPERNGHFHIAAADSGQHVDVQGRVETEFSESDIQFDRESCRYTDYERKKERECRQVCPGDRSNRGNRRNGDDQFDVFDVSETEVDENGCFERCRMVRKVVEVTKYGNQDVEFHYEYEDRDYKIEFMKPAGSTQLGLFQGTWQDRDKIYDYKGFCEGPRSRIWHRRHGHEHPDFLD